jgi:hypothetical protein
MFELKKTTQKQELLNYLIEEVAGPGNLKLFVVSVPAFLDSSLAVDIFINQLKGYPRTLEWCTRSPEIFDILVGSKLSFEHILYDPVKIDSSSGEYKNPDVLEVIEQTILAGQKHTKANFKFPGQTVEYDKMFAPVELPKEQIKPISQATQIPQSEYINPKLIPDLIPQEPQQIVLVATPETPQSIPRLDSNTNESIDFDTWLKNIERAKESLNSVKKNKQFFEGSNPASTLRDSFEEQTSKLAKKSNKFGWAIKLGGVALSAAVLGGIFFGFSGSLFSPDVYTIKVTQERKDKIVTVSLLATDSKSITFDSRVEGTISTSGKADVGSKSKGTIGLVNESNQAVALNNAGFYLQKSGVTYSVSQNSNLPAVLNITGGATGSAFSFDVTANTEGTGTGLAVGERLTLRNLAGSIVSDKLYASVLSEIKLPKQGAFITQTDLDTVSKQNIEKNKTKVLEKIKTLSVDQITTADLATSEIIKETANAKVEEIADTVTLQSDYKNTLAYYERETLATILKKQLTTDRIDSMEIEKIEKNTEGVKATIKTIFYMPQEFKSNEVLDALQNSNNTDSSTSSLKTKFPTIQSIDQKKGFSLFRQQPIIKVEAIN